MSTWMIVGAAAGAGSGAMVGFFLWVCWELATGW